MTHAKMFFPLVAIMALASCGDPPDTSVQQESDTASKAPEPATMARDYADGGIPLSAPDDKAMHQYMEVRALADRGDFIEANQAARELTDEYPEFAGGWIMLANTALSGEQFVKAAGKAADLAANGTRGEQLWSGINMTFISNDAEKRLRLGEELVEAFPESPRAWVVHSGVLGGQNRHEEARASAKKAIELAPDQAFSHSTLAFSYLYNAPKDFALAERHFQHAIDLDPHQDNAWVNIGDAHRAMGDLEAARSDYSKAWELDNSNSVAAIKRGHVNSFLGNFDEARADYDRGIATGKEGNQSTLANYRAFVSVHAGDPQAAIAELQQELARVDTIDMPDDQRAGSRSFILINIADIAFHNDLLDDAANAVGRLSESLMEAGANSGDENFARQQKATATFWQGKLAARQGDYAGAEAKAEEFAALVSGDTNPRKMERYHELRGLIALMQDDFAGAVEQYRQANLSTSPGGGDVKNVYMLAKALLGSGQDQEAGELLEEIANWNFNSAWFAMLRKTAAESG